MPTPSYLAVVEKVVNHETCGHNEAIKELVGAPSESDREGRNRVYG